MSARYDLLGIGVHDFLLEALQLPFCGNREKQTELKDVKENEDTEYSGVKLLHEDAWTGYHACVYRFYMFECITTWSYAE